MVHVNVQQVHRCLSDCLHYCEEIMEGQSTGFQVDAICDAMSTISNLGEDVIDSVVHRLGWVEEEVDFDGVVGTCWLEVAKEWVDRFMCCLAQETGRSFGPAPMNDGALSYGFLPPIFHRTEFKDVRIPFESPALLVRRIDHELQLLTGDDIRNAKKALLSIGIDSRETNVLIAMYEKKIDSPQKRRPQQEIVKADLNQVYEAAEQADESAEIPTGFIYVCKSLSDDPQIANLDDLFKIGFTRQSVEERTKKAKDEPAYLMAAVDVIAEYQIFDVNTQKFELLLHTFFAESCLEIDVFDHSGARHTPREWFVAPLHIIDSAIQLLISGEIVNYRFDPKLHEIVTGPSCATEKIDFHIGGNRGPNYNVTWDGDLLTVQSWDPEKVELIHPPIEASKRKWQNFWKKVEVADVWNWKGNYELPACDGTHWSLEMSHGDRSIKSSGDNDYPQSFDLFLKAIQNLTGRKDIH